MRDFQNRFLVSNLEQSRLVRVTACLSKIETEMLVGKPGCCPSPGGPIQKTDL